MGSKAATMHQLTAGKKESNEISRLPVFFCNRQNEAKYKYGV
jgi:hypothetical protein